MVYATLSQNQRERTGINKDIQGKDIIESLDNLLSKSSVSEKDLNNLRSVLNIFLLTPDIYNTSLLDIIASYLSKDGDHFRRINRARRFYKEKNRDLCPICQGEMRSIEGKFGKFFGCKKYPTCKGSRKADTTPSFNEELLAHILEENKQEGINLKRIRLSNSISEEDGDSTSRTEGPSPEDRPRKNRRSLR